MQNLFRLPLVTLGLASLFAAGTPLLAQNAEPGASELRIEVAHKLPGWLKQYNVPSAAVAYIADGKLAWTVVSGEQSPGVPATDQTLYNIASLTKPLVAETILRMASQGKLHLDEPIYPYWVDLDIKDNPWNKLLTPRLCLSHQTGFANWRRMTNNTLTFKFQPGTQSSYSGEGYFYVARFALNKTQMPFDQLAQQYVLGPVGMKDTSFTTQNWFSGRLAQPYTKAGFAPPALTSTWNAADLVHTTVSTAYGTPKGGSAAVPRNKYVEIRNDKPINQKQRDWPEYKTCKFTTEAIVTEGSEKGELRRVCANPECPVHHAKKQRSNVAADAGVNAEQEKRRREEALAQATGLRVLGAIVEAVPVRLMKRDLLFVVERLAAMLDERRLAIVLRQHGIGKAKSPTDRPAKLLTAFARKSEESNLGRLLVEIVILQSAQSANDTGRMLRESAEFYKVDVDAITAKVKEELAAKDRLARS
jgi:hypothetical protein